MNKERLLQVADLIEKSENDEVFMGSWFGFMMNFDKKTKEYDYWSGYSQSHHIEHLIFDENLFDENKKITCGTTACIAGWAFYSALINNEITDGDLKEGLSISEFATYYLDISLEEASNLFYCEYRSVWTAVKSDYEWDIFDDRPFDWTFPKQDVVDLLKRIVSEDVSLTNEWVDSRIEPDEFNYDYGCEDLL